MATTYAGSGNVRQSVSLAITATLDDGSRVTDQVNDGAAASFSSGTGALKFDQHYHTDLSIAQGATTSLDLNGTVKDAHGRNVALARIKVIKIRNESAVDFIVVGGNENAVPLFSAAADSMIIPPLTEITLVCSSADGWEVTAGTGDILDITHGGDTAAAATVFVEIAGSLT